MLELGFECEQYKSLPMSGGLLDQPAGLMKKIRMALNVYHAVKVYERDGKKAGEMAKWRREHEDIWNIVHEVNELRANYG